MSSHETGVRAERILDAAVRLIIHYGYDKTTVSDIAREAGVSKGAIYLHWPSKEALFEALLIREMQRLLEDVLARVDADPEGGTLGGMYRHGILGLAANPLMRALFTRDARVLGDYMSRQNPERYRQRLQFAQVFTEHMQAAGLIRTDLRPQVVAYLMGIISYGLMSVEASFAPEHTPPLEEVAHALADVVRRGLAPAGGGDSAAGKAALAQVIDSIKRQYAS